MQTVLLAGRTPYALPQRLGGMGYEAFGMDDRNGGLAVVGIGIAGKGGGAGCKGEKRIADGCGNGDGTVRIQCPRAIGAGKCDQGNDYAADHGGH